MDTITITGVVATPVKYVKTTEGLSIASFRLASNQRRYDRQSGSGLPPAGRERQGVAADGPAGHRLRAAAVAAVDER